MNPVRYPSRLLLPFLAGLAGCFLLPGCGPGEEVSITHKRLLPGKEQQPITGASSEERFRSALSMIGMAPQTETQKPATKFAWDTPEGWKAVTGSSMREADFRFGKDLQGECYLMQAGGTLTANVNRWRQQMGLPPIEEAAANQLPKRPLFGRDAYLVSLDGDFTGMGAAGVKKDARMLGVILPFGDVSVFVKMVGSRADVVENEAKFQAFCDSLRLESP